MFVGRNPAAIRVAACVVMGLVTANCLVGGVAAQTIINVPPSSAPPTVGAGTVLNLLEGGQVFGLEGTAGSQINVQGGTANEIFNTAGGAINVSGGLIERLQITGTGNVTGGRVGSLFNWNGATTSLRGGAFERLGAQEGAAVSLYGVDFRLNGVPIAGLSSVGDLVLQNLQVGDVLTGVLADGTAFAHEQDEGHSETLLQNGTLRLVRSADPAPFFPLDITVLAPSTVRRVGDGQRVTVATNGSLGRHFRAGPGSRVDVTGGSVDQAFQAIGATVNVSGGNVGHEFSACEGTVVNLSGGAINDSKIFRNATLNISGGEFVGTMKPGSTMNVSGGTVLRSTVEGGANATISGGNINDLTSAGVVRITGGSIGSLNTQFGQVTIAGGVFDDDSLDIRIEANATIEAAEFRINGQTLSTMPNIGDTQGLTLGPQDVISGVFTDGTPFIFSGYEGQIERPLMLRRSASYTPGPATFTVPADVAPNGLHAGQSLVLRSGGALPAHFTAGHGSAVRIEGGTVDRNFEVIGATADITGGELNSIDAFQGGVVTVNGNVKFGELSLYRGAVGNFVGGQLRGAFHADGANVNFSGGNIEALNEVSTAVNGSVVTLTDGNIGYLAIYDGAKFVATGGSAKGFYANRGSEATIDHATIDFLETTQTGKIRVDTARMGTVRNGGGTIQIFGGALGDHFQLDGGVTELHGYNFQVDGTPIAGLDAVGSQIAWQYQAGQTFTGALSDGTPFNMSADDFEQGFYTNGGVLRLVRTAAAALPAQVEVTDDNGPYGAGAGQTVVVQPGGSLGDHFVAGPQSVVQVNGGAVGFNFEADRSQVTFQGGTVGEGLDVFAGATVNIAGAAVARQWELTPGGTINISSGSMGFGSISGGTLNVAGGTVSGVPVVNQGVVNVSGGVVGSELKLFSGSVANVSGGEVGTSFEVADGARANVSGGIIRALEIKSAGTAKISGGRIESLTAVSGANLEIRGGAYADRMTLDGPASAVIYGNGFQLNGESIPGLNQAGDEVVVARGSNWILAGVLADGTPLALSSVEIDFATSLTLRYQPHAAGPALVDVASNSALLGVHEGQQLNLLSGGVLGDHFTAGSGSVVHIADGVVGRNFEAYQAVVAISGGTIGNDFDAMLGSQVTVTGGVIGSNFDVHAGAQVTIGGGRLAGLDTLPGANMAVTGGKVTRLNAGNSSQTFWSGGVLDSIVLSTQGMLEISGANFAVNGAPVAGLANVGDSVPLTVATGQLLTATLADGTPLVILNDGQSHTLLGGIRLVRSAPATPLPALQEVSDGLGPFAIGQGQILRLGGAGQLATGFIAGPGSLLDVDGGSVGAGLKLHGAALQVSGGQLAGLSVFAGSDVDIRGGIVSGTNLLVQADSTIDIYGKQFLLNGQPISGLSGVGAAKLLTERANQRLTAVLADGSLLDWRLAPLNASPRGPFFGISGNAALTIHLVPEPAGAVLVAISLAAVLRTRRGSRQQPSCLRRAAR